MGRFDTFGNPSEYWQHSNLIKYDNNRHIIRNVFWIFMSISGVTYLLFQKKLLPKNVCRIVARLFFYPTFPLTALLRLNNYWTNIDNTVILGCAPMSFLAHPDELYKLGVRAVVNMCDEYVGPIDDYDHLGIKQLRLKTVDHFEPSVSHIKDAVTFISHYKDLGEKVYVHCKAGHGRGASIALSWILNERPDLTLQEANAFLCSKRKVRRTLYKQPNIREYFRSLKESASKDTIDISEHSVASPSVTENDSVSS